MRPLKKIIIHLSTLYLVFCSIPSLANITDYRFYGDQVHDAQRSPAFPVANNLFTLSYFLDPYRANMTSYKLNAGDYIKLFFVDGACQNGRVGINRYDARGDLLETVQPTGHIYGLTQDGFLHNNDNNIGTFLSTQPLLGRSSVNYTPITGPNPETCATLEAYTQAQTSQMLAIDFIRRLPDTRVPLEPSELPL